VTLLVHEPTAFVAACHGARRIGRLVGLVPTMGNLHRGHLSLVRGARHRGAEFLVVTVFVNPLQFGPSEDFDRYPRTLDADLDACREANVDVVFAPTARSMYGARFQTHVDVTALATPHEGVCRPGHFRGVATVVAKLFNLAGPCLSVFGQKDYQQFCVVRQMAADLSMQVEVVSEPIVRDADGLALSSRNQYLDAAGRTRATSIHRGLRKASTLFAAGTRNAAELRAAVLDEIDGRLDRIDYVTVSSADTLAPIDGDVREPSVIAVAGHVGGTRLIDNILIDPANAL
jgi:pantoate--beta-alanine ligase